MIRRCLRRALPAAAVALAFLAGLSVDRVARAAPRRDTAQPYRSLDVFAEVLAYVRNNYVDEVKEQDLVYGAIDGLVQKLDPHSAFLRPDVYRMMRDETSGEFDGVGLELVLRDEQLTVLSPIADSPAERAGLRPGDRILQIDGVPTREMVVAEAARRMKGPAGTQVVLQVMREGFRDPQAITLVRDHVRTAAVDWRVLDAAAGVALVRVKSFQDRTDRQLRKALDDVRAALKGEIHGLILDLRNNPGGLLDQAVRVADRFLASGVIVSTEGRGRRAAEVERAREKDTEPGYPVVVLVNRGSASASEIVAGALQDHGRAVILGAPTFGKGSVQTVIELEDGSALKLTVAKYYTPKHRSIQDSGITPDLAVGEASTPARAEPSERDAAPHARPGPRDPPHGGARPPGAADPQVERALDVLRAARILRPAAAGAEAPPGGQGPAVAPGGASP
jgi:carboxyl-terminal processing protease